MRPMTIGWIALVAGSTITLLACRDDQPPASDDPATCRDDQLPGGYRVSSHTLNSTACDQEGAPTSGRPYFRLERAIFSGRDALLLYWCSSAEGCDVDPSLGWYHDPASGGWGGDSRLTACGCPTPCTGDCCSGSVTILADRLGCSGGGVRFEKYEKSGTVARPTCDEVTDVSGDDPALSCSAYEVVVGERAF